MKRFFAFCLSIYLFASCSDKHDVIIANTPEAGLRFSKDTVFVREKDHSNINNTGNGMFEVYATPSVRQMNMQYTEPTGKVHFSYRGDRLIDSKPFVVAGDSSKLFCSVDTPGVYTVDFYMTDQLGRIVGKQLIVKCDANTKPIAALEYEPMPSLQDNWLYFFNASGSRQPYGTIVSYHYIINGQAYTTNRPSFKWFFHQAGTQQVSSYVLDDLGASSDTLHFSIDIP